ncbi:MAG TPA: phytanoyl-CoA dioxygenase [Candidatus Latescibacteria bacterium]|nr:phytanoyl-CoA dioxygenase [Candidatus Handelsmanbacteria bacterium]HIL07546.1 phytanoyl-CoA dioxygenase [Candidatus Latescibacterota bacterium]
MAQFVADGLLRFDELVPDELNQAACAEMEAGVIRGKAGEPLDDMWQDTAIGQVVRLPAIQGMIESLVGPGPLYDHHAVHTVNANHEHGQIWHADAIIDTRMHFDVQFFYFAHDTPREMGGTMFLPGSQFRRVSESDIARYQNFLGQMPMVCKAGTVAVAHHGIWHCAQPNLTDNKRYMFKLRLNPTVRQKKLWNTDDIDDAEIPGLLNANHRWYGNEVRLEAVNRIKMWRFLTGDDNFDLSYWLSRLENAPENELRAA